MATKTLKHGPATVLLRELAETRKDEATLARFSIAIAEALAALPADYDPGAPYEKLMKTSKTLCGSKDKLACYWLGLVSRGKQASDVISYLTKGCKLGEAESCNDLGYVYASGEGIPADAANAMKFYKKACSLKLPAGCKNLAGLDKK